VNSANNNYPLRGSKLSSFEGLLRVAQFLTGDWIDKHMDANRDTIPDTYAVVNDWATTLLGMAGADKTWLLGDSAGPAYGNDTWKYIENSVNSSSSERVQHQLERNMWLACRIQRGQPTMM